MEFKNIKAEDRAEKCIGTTPLTLYIIIERSYLKYNTNSANFQVQCLNLAIRENWFLSNRLDNPLGVCL